MNWWILYYVASALLWLWLAILTGLSLWPQFYVWLKAHPDATATLLGINRLPPEPKIKVMKFYAFLTGGWTWLLIWSWWLMPWCRKFFYRAVNSEQSFQIARFSTMLVLVAYSVFGFYFIGRGIIIWFREIYNHPIGNDHLEVN